MCKCGCGYQKNYGNNTGCGCNGYNKPNYQQQLCHCRRELEEAEDVIQAIYDLADDYLEEDTGCGCNNNNGYHTGCGCNNNYSYNTSCGCNNNYTNSCGCRYNYWGR